MTKRLMAFFAVFLMSTLLLMGCSVKGANDLLGTYRAELPGGEETLELLADGNCHQEINLKNGDRLIANGRWKFDESSSRLYLTNTRVALDGFGRMNTDISHIPSGGTGYLPVTRTFFGKIVIGSDDGIRYVGVQSTK